VHKEIEKAILQTLIYSDIFSYPLSKDELWNFLINKKIDKKSFINQLKNLKIEKIKVRNNFYYLSGRESIVNTRIQRNKASRKKIVIAKTIIKKLSFLPTIQFIGISGALSLGNATKEDDIDLFVIASKNRLWLTRLSIIIFLLLRGSYRKRNDQEVSDKMCLNMLIDETALAFPKIRHNLYTAHEIVQLMPIFDRNDMYKKFINANEWIKDYLPNAFSRGTKRNYTRNNAESIISVVMRSVQRSSALENLAKAIQLWFIKKHITNETITDSLLAFHPNDYTKKVLKEYKKRLRIYV